LHHTWCSAPTRHLLSPSPLPLSDHSKQEHKSRWWTMTPIFYQVLYSCSPSCDVAKFLFRSIFPAQKIDANSELILDRKGSILKMRSECGLHSEGRWTLHSEADPYHRRTNTNTYRENFTIQCIFTGFIDTHTNTEIFCGESNLFLCSCAQFHTSFANSIAFRYNAFAISLAFWYNTCLVEV
jgi:hypothetical protein